MPHPDWHHIFSLGLLLAAALAGGVLAQFLRLPRVTAYLSVGVLLGPQMLHAVHENSLAFLDPLGKLAMALVLFNIGCHFTLVYLRRILARALRFSAGELGLTFVLVSAGLLLLGESWASAFLFAALALATAPATTILVLSENNSEGPVTEYATILVVLNNLAAVIVFELLFLIAHFLLGRLKQPFAYELLFFARDLLGSVALGVAVGLITSYCCGLLPQTRWLVLLIAAATLLLGVSEALQIPYLLTFLAMGVTVANSSDRSRGITEELDRVTTLLCVVFFVIHGAELKIWLLYDEVIAGRTGLIYLALAYIVLRSAGKYLGIYCVGRNDHDGPEVRRWLGATLVAQAGAAIALSAIAADKKTGLGELGERLQLIILSTVVFFELVGPILIQTAVRQAGEVPLSQALRHTTTTVWEELAGLLNRLRAAAGIDPWKNRLPEELTVAQFMRRNVNPILISATLKEVLATIEHSHDNTFPVIDADGTLFGVIRYSDIRDALFDPNVDSLIRAIDLVVPTRHLLFAEESLDRAWRQLQSSHDDCLPVVSGEAPHAFVGIVRQRDLFRFFAKSKSED